MSRNVERQAKRAVRLGADKDVFDEALTCLRRVHAKGVRPTVIKIRADFIYAPKSVPPIEAISAPKGLNLQLYLLLLFEVQCHKRAGGVARPSERQIFAAPDKDPWVDIVFSRARSVDGSKGFVDERRNRTRQIQSAFARLESKRLVRKTGPRNRRQYLPLHESGGQRWSTDHPYVVPTSEEVSPEVIVLPAAFFTHGWVYLMSMSEIRTYLALRHLSDRYPGLHRSSGIYCGGRERTDGYHLSRDVYESHLMLADLGLVRRLPDGKRHGDGKLVDFARVQRLGREMPAHRFKVEPDEVFKDAAYDRYQEALRRGTYQRRGYSRIN